MKTISSKNSAADYPFSLDHMNHERKQLGHPPVTSVAEGMADNLRRMEENEAKWAKDFERREANKTQE